MSAWGVLETFVGAAFAFVFGICLFLYTDRAKRARGRRRRLEAVFGAATAYAAQLRLWVKLSRAWTAKTNLLTHALIWTDPIPSMIADSAVLIEACMDWMEIGVLGSLLSTVTVLEARRRELAALVSQFEADLISGARAEIGFRWFADKCQEEEETVDGFSRAVAVELESRPGMRLWRRTVSAVQVALRLPERIARNGH